MPDPLIFMMGEFAAEIPTDRRYARNHMWAVSDQGAWRFGFTAYAVRLLQDVYFLDWDFEPPGDVKEKTEIGQIESSKAESALYSPIAGRLTEFNQDLLTDPSAINVDKYGAGWLFEIEGPGEELMDAAGYIKHLEAVWEITQRTIKGQLNQ